MKNPSKEEVIIRLQLIKNQCDEMIDMVQQIIPEKEWYSTGEAAEIVGVKPKTATNYCATGVWSDVKKDARGRYLIHKSELQNHQP